MVFWMENYFSDGKCINSIVFFLRCMIGLMYHKTERLCCIMAKMSKDDGFNLRMTTEQRKELEARTVAAGLFTKAEYVRQVLFVHDTGADMRKAWFAAVGEMKQERKAMQDELKAARESIEEAARKLMQERKAGTDEMKEELLKALEKAHEKIIHDAADRQEEKYITDPLLYPCMMITAFLAGVVFS